MRRAVAAALGLAGLAVLFVLSGVVSVKASSGHLAVTAWVLDLAKRRSVAVRASPIESPALDAPGLEALGASHFDRGCRPCHGAPGEPPPAVPARMTPHPPDLAAQVGRWKPRELFYLVAHGVKFTGMPAWPSPSRTDEVWAVVAFLRRLPALARASYRRLANLDAVAPPTPDGLAALAATCTACHDGASPLVPRLTGQTAEYLTAALDAYADGRRFSGIMQPIAVAVPPDDRPRLARLVAGPTVATVAPGPAPLSRLVVTGDPARDVPACAECHGPSDTPRDPRYPVVAGQPAAYVRLQLALFAEGRRGGTPAAEIMRPIAQRLSPTAADDAARAFAAMTGVR